MTRKRQLLGVLGWVAFLLAGCGSSASTRTHTHLWTSDQQQHVWSYERVVSTKVGDEEPELPYEYLQRELRAGETIELEGGAMVFFDGAQLKIGQRLIREKNVHVERDGSLRINAFIRESR